MLPVSINDDDSTAGARDGPQRGHARRPEVPRLEAEGRARPVLGERLQREEELADEAALLVQHTNLQLRAGQPLQRGSTPSRTSCEFVPESK